MDGDTSVNGVDIQGWLIQMYMVLARLRLLPTGLHQMSNETPSNHMIEMDPPLTISRRRGLGNVSICNKTLKAKSRRKEMLHYSSEWIALASPG